MRTIDTLIIHCSATPASMDIGAKEIDVWHRQRGFNEIGYHYVIRRNGQIERGRDESEIGAHAQGHNATSIGLCLVGGVERDRNGGELIATRNFTSAQWQALHDYVVKFLIKYPSAKVIGHRDVNRYKACPSFSVSDWLANESIRFRAWK